MLTLGRINFADVKLANEKPLAGNKVLNGVLLSVLFILFTLTYVDNVIAPQFGWWQYYAWRMECGDVLYKDIYLFMPPYFVFLTKWLYPLFGMHIMLYTLFVGLPVKLLCILLIYNMVCRIAKPFYTCMAVLFGACLSATYFTDMLYDFNPITMFACLLTAHVFLCLYERVEKGESAYGMAFLTGCLLAVVFGLKQTFGLSFAFTIVIMGVVVCVKEKMVSVKQALILFSLAFGGGVVGLMPMIAYLSLNGCWQEFVGNMAGIAEAKGGTSHVFLRFLLPLDNLKAWVYLLVVVVLWQLQKRVTSSRRGADSIISNNLVWWLVGTVFAVAIVMYGKLPYTFHESVADNSFIHKWIDRIYYMMTYGGLVAWCMMAWRYFSGRAVDKSLLVFTSLLTAQFFTGVVSTDYLEPIYLLIYTPWMVAYALNASCSWQPVKNLLLISLVTIISLACISSKKDCPYSWQGWREPAVSAENVNCTVPGLEGLSVPTDVDKTFNQFVSLINEHTTADDKVLQFANIPLFNLLTERATPGYAPITWFDVCPDEIAEGVARECFAHPPKMVVWHNMDQENWDTVEKVFRNGQRSGQREIQRFYDEVVTRDYRLLLRANNHRDGMLELWLRNTR